MQRRALALGTTALAGVILSGCVSSPSSRSERLEVEVPGQWAAGGVAQEAFAPQDWARDFGDAKLEAIIAEALELNFDLKVAVARLDAATAGFVSAGSDIWPTVTLSGSGSKARRSGASGIQQTLTSETYGLNGRLAWEIDLWGKVRNGYRGDLADAEAAIADYEAARLSIAGRVAKAWYAAIEAIQLLELEQRSLEALLSSAQIVEENFASGIARALDVRLVRANVASSQSTLEQRRRARDQAVRTLETLLGRYPANELAVAADLPTIRRALPAGLPSELLLRRPDVVAAERRLAAAEQRKFEASKARLPSIDLALSRGTSANTVGDALELVESRIWTQSLTIAQTLFQGRRLAADARRAKALYEQNVAAYAQTVLGAFREVENAIGAQDSYEIDYDAQVVAAAESIEAEKLAWEEYGRGLSDITTALDAVRRSITAQRSLIQVSNQRLQSRVDLYLALGGGFEIEPVVAEQSTF